MGLSPPNLSAIAHLTSCADDKKCAETNNGHDYGDDSNHPKKALTKVKAAARGKTNGVR